MNRKEELHKRIENDFTYHAPFGTQVARYNALREAAKNYAHLIVDMTPVSREQSLALTHLEQAVMMANAAIARNEHEVAVAEESFEEWQKRQAQAQVSAGSQGQPEGDV